ncbi:MAG: hypothetical protein AAGJ46_10455 [Planctomycetota bacterium]
MRWISAIAVATTLVLLAPATPAGAQEGRFGSADPEAAFRDLAPLNQPGAGPAAPSMLAAPPMPNMGAAPLPLSGSPQQPARPRANPLREPTRPAAPSATGPRPDSRFNAAPAAPPRSPRGASAPRAQSGTQPRNRSSNAIGPESIIQWMHEAPSDSQLAGSPLTIAQVISDSPSRMVQSQRVEAYWDLCSSVADYYLGLREAEELGNLQQRLGTGRMSNALRQAAQGQRVRVETSLLSARAAQHRLASVMGRNTLPLPGDLPFCGRYDTKLSQIFPTGAPAEADELHRLLPLRYAELQASADGITRAQQWVGKVATVPTQTGDGMIRALELLAYNRRAFVQLARDYNRRITRYTELSRPGRIDNGRLVAMLIGVDDTRLSQATGQPGSSQATFRSPRVGPNGFR